MDVADSEGNMRCTKCNYQLKKEWNYCPNCNKKVRQKNLIIYIIFIYLPFLILFFFNKTPIYGFLITTALFSNLLITYILINKKVSNLEYIYLMIFEFIGIVIGAKLFTLFSNFNVNKNLTFVELGLSSYGGVIGYLLSIFLYSLTFKDNIKIILKNTIIPIPLMYAIGKIGCHIAGCCYGIKYNGLLSIKYQGIESDLLNVNLFPVQLTETFIFTIIFLYIFFKRKEKYIVAKSFILCGIAKFSLDYLRYSHINQIISLNQIISIIFIIIGIIIFIKEKHDIKSKKTN